MKPFHKLARRGRLRRSRGLAETALASYGLAGALMSFIQHGENMIYRVDAPGSISLDDAGPYIANRYVLRILASDDVDMIASELTWLAALNHEADRPVPAPVPMPDGELLATILTRGIPQGRIVSLMRWLDGRRLRHGLRPRHLTALGEIVAQLHTFSAAWQVPADFQRPTWNWDAQLGGSMFDHSREELVASLPGRYREPFLVVAQQAKCVN